MLAAAEVLATGSAEVPASKAANPTKAGRRVAPVSRRFMKNSFYTIIHKG